MDNIRKYIDIIAEDRVESSRKLEEVILDMPFNKLVENMEAMSDNQLAKLDKYFSILTEAPKRKKNITDPDTGEEFTTDSTGKIIDKTVPGNPSYSTLGQLKGARTKRAKQATKKQEAPNKTSSQETDQKPAQEPTNEPVQDRKAQAKDKIQKAKRSISQRIGDFIGGFGAGHSQRKYGRKFAAYMKRIGGTDRNVSKQQFADFLKDELRFNDPEIEKVFSGTFASNINPGQAMSADKLPQLFKKTGEIERVIKKQGSAGLQRNKAQIDKMMGPAVGMSGAKVGRAKTSKGKPSTKPVEMYVDDVETLFKEGLDGNLVKAIKLANTYKGRRARKSLDELQKLGYAFLYSRGHLN